MLISIFQRKAYHKILLLFRNNLFNPFHATDQRNQWHGLRIITYVLILVRYASTTHIHCTKKWSFPLRISSVNVTKSAVSYGFGHIYWRNPYWKTPFFVQWQILKIVILKVLEIVVVTWILSSFSDVTMANTKNFQTPIFGNPLRCICIFLIVDFKSFVRLALVEMLFIVSRAHWK